MTEIIDPQTIRAASQVLTVIDRRHGLLQDQDRELKEQEAKAKAAEQTLQATLEANAAGLAENADIEAENARLREERRTLKAELEHATLRAKEALRDATGRLENVERQINLAIREREEVYKSITAAKAQMPSGGMR